MNCECINWDIVPLIKKSRKEDKSYRFHNHHHDCPKYKTEKIGRLFYWEEAVSSYCPVPDKVENIISEDNLSDGETNEIKFKRIDMTQHDFDNLPEG